MKTKRKQWTIAQKLEMVEARRSGLNLVEVATLYGAAATSVSEWAARYEKSGIAGLENEPRPKRGEASAKVETAAKLAAEITQANPEAGVGKVQGELSRHGFLSLARETVRKLLRRQGHAPIVVRSRRRPPQGGLRLALGPWRLCPDDLAARHLGTLKSLLIGARMAQCRRSRVRRAAPSEKMIHLCLYGNRRFWHNHGVGRSDQQGDLVKRLKKTAVLAFVAMISTDLGGLNVFAQTVAGAGRVPIGAGVSGVAGAISRNSPLTIGMTTARGTYNGNLIPHMVVPTLTPNAALSAAEAIVANVPVFKSVEPAVEVVRDQQKLAVKQDGLASGAEAMVNLSHAPVAAKILMGKVVFDGADKTLKSDGISMVERTGAEQPGSAKTNLLPTHNDGADKSSRPSVPGGDKNDPAPPRESLTWAQFFSGVGAALVGAPVSAIGHVPLAIWYAPQAYWYGYQLIWTSKEIGVKLKLGSSFLLTLGVPLVVALTPVAGMIHGIGRGFQAARKEGFVGGVSRVWQDVKWMKARLAEVKMEAIEQVARQRGKPGNGKPIDLSLLQLASGVGGALISLAPLPVPATLIVLAQSPRFVVYGFRALWWRTNDLDVRYKLAITLLFPLAYVLINVLILPAAALYGLGVGFIRGKEQGLVAAFRAGWEDVKKFNRAINSQIAELKKGSSTPDR